MCAPGPSTVNPAPYMFYLRLGDSTLIGSSPEVMVRVEDGEVTVTRARLAVRFPARLMLVAALNPCPCGHAGSTVRPCTCSPQALERYQARLSGPLLDRIDIQIEVQALEHEIGRAHV